MNTYTCPTETMRLSDFVGVFKESLSEILPPKIQELGDLYKLLSEQLEKMMAELKLNFRKVMVEHAIAKDEWELYWMFATGFNFDLCQLKNKVAVVKTELDLIMNTYMLWRVAMGFVDPKDELNIEMAKDFPIANLLSGKIIKSGKNLKACCPMHGEKTPSFFIYPDNTWYCYGCGKGGDVIKFVQDLDGVDFQTAVRRLSNGL